MSGGDMQMDYNQESMYFKGHCIEYDTIDMFQMMVDIALEPRSVLAANVAKSKNAKSHSLHEHLIKFDPSADDHELLLRTAFGYNTLGMPRLGMSGNINYLDARVLQQFIMDNITPKKCLIVAGGVKNHTEYVELVKERLGDVLAVPEHHYARKSSEYIGGEYRTWTESPQTSIQVAFQSVPWAHNDVPAFQIMNELIGQANAFGAGNSGRAHTVVRDNGFVDTVSGINSNFTDSGLFGIKITGSGSHSADLLKVCIDQLNGLRQPINETELIRAKNTLKMNFMLAMEGSGDRLEEVARNYQTHGSLTLWKHCEAIDAVTSHQINAAATAALAGKPTMVVTGGSINLVPSITDVQRQLH
jgi:predicted Zn-dependent peptidase